MTHLTLCGNGAGTVICGAPKVETEQYFHAAYAPIEKLKNNKIAGIQPLCPKCLKMWNESESYHHMAASLAVHK